MVSSGTSDTKSETSNSEDETRGCSLWVHVSDISGHITTTNASPTNTKYRKRILFFLGIFLGCKLPSWLTRLGVINESHYSNSRQALQSLLKSFNATSDIDIDELDLSKRWERLLNGAWSGDYNTLLSPGERAASEGLIKKYPVIIVPGFTSSGLEIWRAEDCLKNYFRQDMWGTMAMAQAVITNTDCWIQHMCLNKDTGMDPDGISIRSVEGMAAADYFVGVYWLWGKIIENLAQIGYTPNDMHVAAYDWRLSPYFLEKRDSYLTRLKSTIETMKSTSDEKVVLMSHSYGSLVLHYFFNWVAASKEAGGGGGGKDWVDQHIATTVNIAGPLLGVPKAMSALLSGELRDTADLRSLVIALDAFVSLEARAGLFRTWSSLVSMSLRGGNAMWGNTTHSHDACLTEISKYCKLKRKENICETREDYSTDEEKQVNDEDIELPTLKNTNCYGSIFNFADGTDRNNLTVEDVWETLLKPRLPEVIVAQEDFSSAAHIADLDSNNKFANPKYWNNVLTSTLPNAPNMKMFCLYGVGEITERSYMYRDRHQGTTDTENIPFRIDNTVNTDGFKNGVNMCDGDGSVPLLSLGFMCAEGWKNKAYPFNPAGISVNVVEYLHSPQGIDPRGGGTSGHHLDIMGHTELMYNLLQIAAGHENEVEERYLSSIRELSSSVSLK
eukprot:123771_1